MKVYSITVGDGRTTEELVVAANYGYCHSQVISENFPARPFKGKTVPEIVLLSFDHPVSSEVATSEAAKQGLERPFYEDALHFGIEHPDVQLEGPVAFLHDLGWATMGGVSHLSLEQRGPARAGLGGL